MAKQEKSQIWKNFSEVNSQVKSGQFSSLYLITGEEKFLIDRLVNEIKAKLLAPGAESLDFYAKDQTNAELSLDDFQSLVGTPPFLSTRRVTLIKNTGWWSGRSPSTPKDVEAWKKAIESVPEFATVLFVEDKVDNRKKQLVDAAAGSGVLAEIDFMDEDALSNIIETAMKKRGITIPPDCVSSLISRVDSSMRMCENEMAKLRMYCENQGITTLNMQILDMLCIPDVHASVFNMTDAIGMRRTDRAMEIFQNLIFLKEPIPKIRLMLARHIRHLICAKELGDVNQTRAALKIQPFVARNLVSQAKGFSMGQLEQIYNMCYKSDMLVKSGKMDDQLAMEVLLASCGRI